MVRESVPEGYKEIEVGVIPEDWEVKRLGDIADIRTGKKNNEDKVVDGQYPFFVRSQKIERIDTYSYEGEALLVPGDGGIGDIYHYINDRFDYHQRVYKISDFSDSFCGKFIYYCMVQNFSNHALRNSVKATVNSLRLPTFEEFEILYPPLPEQQAIAQILSDMDAEIESLQKKRDKYKLIKEGMMDKLLTGKVRLI
jgi:type I restriction enzyme S subunit